MRKLSILFLILLLLYSCGGKEGQLSEDAEKAAPSKDLSTAPRMTKEELKALLEDPDSGVIILDVRTTSTWQESDAKIKSAAREAPTSFDSWAGKYPQDKPIVLYCA